jgi:hypothetical protein
MIVDTEDPPALKEAIAVLRQSLAYFMAHGKFGKVGVRIHLNNGSPHTVEEDFVATRKLNHDEQGGVRAIRN